MEIFRTRTRLRGRCALCILMCLMLGVVIWNGLFFRSIQTVKPPGGTALIEQSQRVQHAPRLFAPAFQNREVLLPARAETPNAPTNCIARQSQQLSVSAILPADPTQLEETLAQTCFLFDRYLPEWFVADQAGLHLSPEVTEHPTGEDVFTRLPAHLTWPVIRTEGPAPAGEALRVEVNAWLTKHAFPGICLRLSDVDESWFEAWLEIARVSGGIPCLILTPDQASLLSEDAIRLTDQIFVQTQQETSAYAPGPITDDARLDEILAQLRQRIPDEKLTFLIQPGGRNWRSGRGRAETLGFAEIMRRLNRYNALPSFDPVSANSFADYMNEQGERNLIWFTDAATFHRQISDRDLHRIAITDVRHADPAIWALLSDPQNPETLRNSDLSLHIRYTGTGPFHDFRGRARSGSRKLTITDGRITDVTWERLPLPWVIHRWGKPQSNLVALTFDDGPDMRFTGRILEILREHEVPASFFPIGTQMLGQKSLLERMYRDGHEVGLHTFSHAQLENMSTWRLTSELKLQQRMFASMTGRNSMLFRAPYVPGSGPMRAEVARQMQAVDEMGYVILGSDIVPPDWTGMTANEIAEHVVAGIVAGKGNVVLLHDGGGNRESTVQALPLIITRLKALGYQFTPAGGLINQARADLMPAAPHADRMVESTSFAIAGFIRNNIHIGFAFIIGLGTIRGCIVLLAAIRRRPGTVPDPSFRPSVNVIIPAYNEEKVIIRTVRAILASDYKDLSVTVVDDGSTDATASRLSAAFGSDNRVTILSQRNQGKWAAANTALNHSQADVIVAIDADTLVDRKAIRFLIQRLANPQVGAVAGNVRVGNAKKAMTRLQSLEYIYAQQIERRAYECINGIMVVPGAIGAWRRSALQQLGGYSPQTLTEDADMTVALIRAGYRVEFEERAFTWTEAPENLKGFMAQRLRWTLGMIQTGWKHRRALRRCSGLGWITLPDLLIFGVLMSLLAPLIDVFIFFACIHFIASLWQGDLPATNAWLFAGYACLPLLELLSSAIALKFDGRRQYGLLWYFPLKRIVYRQLLILTLYRALWRAISGRLARWNKLPRMASVRVDAPYAPQTVAAE